MRRVSLYYLVWYEDHFKELRQRLVQYEAQQTNHNKMKQSEDKKKSQAIGTSNKNIASKLTKKCYNCGDSSHLGKDCPDKSKGTKCYQCGDFGHVAAKCTKNPKMPSKDIGSARVDMLQACGDKKTYKTVNILGKDVVTVINPGSDLHLLRASLYVQLGAPKIRQEIVEFNGVEWRSSMVGLRMA